MRRLLVALAMFGLVACGADSGPVDSQPPEGFVWIEAGSFMMGSPESDPWREPNGLDETEHEVTITNDFYLSDHETTQAEWQALIGNNPSGKNNGTCPTCPVEQVNWWEALRFANALSESEGLTACYVLSGCNENALGLGTDEEIFVCVGVTLQDRNGDSVTTPYECEGYRLPTEAEWEYAARAGTTTSLYNGELMEPIDSDPNADMIAWYYYNSDGTTHAVKGKSPNAWGFYDMSGNVWEWTWDWYGPYSAEVTNPVGPREGPGRVFRGGSWGDVPSSVRLAYRDNNAPAYRFRNIGFRLARTR